MDTYKAEIQIDNTRILRSVTVYLELVTGPSGIKSWYGVFQLPTAQDVEPGGPYRIVLDDGRTGDILITNVTISSHSPTQVSFRGTGPLA